MMKGTKDMEFGVFAKEEVEEMYQAMISNMSKEQPLIWRRLSGHSIRNKKEKKEKGYVDWICGWISFFCGNHVDSCKMWDKGRRILMLQRRSVP